MTTEKEVELMRMRCELLNLSTAQILIEGKINVLENELNITQLKAEQLIDEGCVGCCKVVDIAARLQEELKDCHKLALNESNRVQCDTELIEKLHMELHNRDTIIKNFKAIETKETDRLHKAIEELSAMVETKTKVNRDIIHDKNTTIEDLNSQLTVKRSRINTLHGLIKNLDDELSARKHDSVVLKEVVEIVKNWDDLSVVDRYSTSTIIAMRRLYNVVNDYTDVPEEPEDTTIDESDMLKKIRALVDDWSVNKKGGHQSFSILSKIDDMLKSTQHIDEPQEITVTFAFLELP